MSKQYDSEGFMSAPLEGSGARPKDNYHPDSEDNEVRFREADEEYQRLKADFARIARARRLNSHSRSDSSRSSSPLGRQSQKRATNLPKFRIATFYASDVELWFNQIETQFALHQIDDDDERYSLTCAALSGEIASDVRDVLLQPFRSNKYDSLKAILIERRGLTTLWKGQQSYLWREDWKWYSLAFPAASAEDCRFRHQSCCGKGCNSASVHTTDARFHQSPFGDSTWQCHPRKFGRFGRPGTGSRRGRRRE